MIPIVEDYLFFIREGMRILDVGCGSWDMIKGYCKKIGAHYEGIDTEIHYFGKKTVATHIENLAELSFPNEYFELVIGNQTMEHWGENGCTLRWGLYQCFRVCKQNGQVLMNVPIHFHGTREFMLGELEALSRLFIPFSGQISFHKWGSPRDVIGALFPFPGYWLLRDRPAYILDIQAVKDRPLPSGYTNSDARSGRLAQLLNYPLSYNVYRVLRKAGIFRQGRITIHSNTS